MVNSLFKFLEKNKVNLTDEVKKTITESFNAAVKEKTVDSEKNIATLTAKLEESKTVLKEAAKEIKALRTTKLEEVKKEVENHKTMLTEKLNKYLEYKLEQLVPKHLLEAQAKLEVYEPLVESIKNSFETKGLQIDTKGFGILKEAKAEILKTRTRLDEEIAKRMELEEASEKLLGKYFLNEQCQGLTPDQSKKIKKIFEGSTYDEIKDRFKSVRELVLVEETDTKDSKVIDIKKKRVNEEYSPETKVDELSPIEKEWAKIVAKTV